MTFKALGLGNNILYISGSQPFVPWGTTLRGPPTTHKLEKNVTKRGEEIHRAGGLVPHLASSETLSNPRLGTEQIISTKRCCCLCMNKKQDVWSDFQIFSVFVCVDVNDNVPSFVVFKSGQFLIIKNINLSNKNTIQRPIFSWHCSSQGPFITLPHS